MADLTAAQRDAKPDSDFAIVRGMGRQKVRQYPIHDKAHAVDALARVEQDGSPADQDAVKRAVCRRYSDLPACSTNITALAGQMSSRSRHLS